MIMSINGFENEIEFKENSVNVLEIVNKKLFSNFINNINEQSNEAINDDNSVVLFDENERVQISKNIYLMTDLFNIDLNEKKIINKFYNLIAENIRNNQDNQLENLIINFRNYLINEINELPFEFTMDDDLEISDLLKIFKVKIDVSCYCTIMEKIEFIINVLSTLKIANILVIPNLKTYLNEEELVELYKYSVYNNINLLVVENSTSEKKLKYEVKNIIDENFDEI